MIDPDPQNQVGAMVVHEGGSIVYADDLFRSLVDVESSRVDVEASRVDIQPRDSLVGTSLLEWVSSSDRDALAGQFDRIEAGSAPALGFTTTLDVRSDHSEEVVALSSPIEWDGRDRIQTVFIPVTPDLRSVGLAMKTMDTSPVGITIADARREDEPLIYVNDTFVELTGYPREEALGRNCRFLQGDNTESEAVARMRRAVERGEPVTVEVRNYRKDGSMFWNRVSIRPVRNDDGELTHFLGFQEDVTPRKLYEQEKTLFEMQADSVDKSILITDAEGTIQYVNSQFEQTTGYTAEEAIGQTPQILKSGAQEEAFYEKLWGTITAGDVWEGTITNKRKSGERYTVDLKIVPVTDREGTVTHFVAIEEDITDREFVEEVLNVMNRVLRHNLRNSVTVIKGYTDMLEHTEEDPDHRAAIRAIREQATKLERISDRAQDIRELFRRRNQRHTLAIETLSNFVQQRRDRHPGTTIDLSIGVDPDLEIQNGSLLLLAIDETLENAIVHSDREHPHVEVSVTNASNGEEICVEIADDGPGIPESEWNVIFSGRETPLAHGSGIGLWLMYWTITALGGTLELWENEPRGSVITYRVPLGVNERTEQWNPGRNR